MGWSYGHLSGYCLDAFFSNISKKLWNVRETMICGSEGGQEVLLDASMVAGVSLVSNACPMMKRLVN